MYTPLAGIRNLNSKVGHGTREFKMGERINRGSPLVSWNISRSKGKS